MSLFEHNQINNSSKYEVSENLFIATNGDNLIIEISTTPLHIRGYEYNNYASIELNKKTAIDLSNYLNKEYSV